MIRQLLHSILVALLFLVLNFQARAQGWEQLYPNSQDYAFPVKILPLADGNYMVVNEVRAAVTNRWLQFVKIAPDGSELWQREVYPPDPVEGFQCWDINLTDDGGFLAIGGQTTNQVEDRFALMIEFNATGDIIWSRTFPEANYLTALLSNPDMTYLVGGTTDDYSDTQYWFIRKVDANGDSLWQYTEAIINPIRDSHNGPRKIIQLPNGNALILTGVNGTIKLVELTPDGDFVVEHQMENPYNYHLTAQDLVLTPEGDLVLSGAQPRSGGDNARPHAGTVLWKLDINREQLWIMPTDSTLSSQWIPSLAPNDQGEIFISRNRWVEKIDCETGQVICEINTDGLRNWTSAQVLALDDGEALIAAAYSFSPSPISDRVLTVAQMNNECVAAQERILGYAFKNESADCTSPVAGDSLANWLIELSNDDYSFYQLTDSSGYYEFAVPTGDYSISAFPPMHYWQSCVMDMPITLNISDTVLVDIPNNALEDCPFPVTDLAVGNLRPCLERPAAISYANLGTTTVEGAYLELQLASSLTITQSSHLYTLVGDDLYEFTLGNLEPGEAGQIQLQLLAECDLTLVDSIVCLQAELLPRNDCGDNAWDGPIIQLNSNCEGNTVTFEVKNIGTQNMTGPQELIVIEDDVMYMQSDFELDIDESTILEIPNEHATYAARAEQVADYPFGDYAYGFISNCYNPGLDIPFSTLFLGQFPFNDLVPYLDVECVTFVNSYDPNQKTASPAGFGPSNYIEPSTRLEYHIDFQNTGTDTAYLVQIRDTLSEHLDLFSLRVGAATHDYELSIENGGILIFTFKDINLVDSTTNEPLSHGFVEYSITPVNELPDETIILNSAAIYFDLNPPIITNTTLHTIKRDFLILEVDEPYRNQLQLTAYPNPVSNGAIIGIKDFAPPRAQMQLYNSLGQRVSTLDFRFGRSEKNVNLPAGVYFFQLHAEQRLLGTGKLIVQ